MRKNKTKKIALFALLTAVITACAWISILMPSGVSLTFSLFGVCLCGFLLGAKGALTTTITYILLGAVGVPVFSSFSGGIGVILGPSGGFLCGFMFAAVLCGIAKHINTKATKYLLMVLSVIICHLIGIIQFSLVTGNGVWAAFLSSSLPFLLKDIMLVFLAQIISKKIKI